MVHHGLCIVSPQQNGFVTGSTQFESVQLESAISGVIFELIEREKTVADSAYQAILHYLQEVDNTYSRYLNICVDHMN